MINVDIRRVERRYSIVLSADLDDQTADTIAFYSGADREGLENELLEETGASTLLFTGGLFWADAEAEILSFDGLTENIDQMTVRMKFTYSGGQYHEFEITFAEDENDPESGQFIATIWEPIDGLDLGGCISLVLPETFDPQMTETTTIFMGDRNPDDGDFILSETSLNSLAFTGNTSWADVTVSLVDFQPLTSSIDTIDTEWTFRHRDGSEDALHVTMTETGAESCRFGYDLGEEDVYTVFTMRSGTDSGTFLPAIIRIHAPEGTIDENTRVNTFDRDWEVKQLYGGCTWYVVDDQDNAVVFLPAAYAETHIQCKPLPNQFMARFRLNGEMLNFATPVRSGLVVLTEGGVDDMLSPHLAGYKGIPNHLGGRPAIVYTRDEDFDHIGDSVETEIYWRLVGDEQLVTICSGRADLDQHIKYRLAAVRYAPLALFGFKVGIPDLNDVFWKVIPDADPEKVAILVRDGRSASEALCDLFDSFEDPAMACLLGMRMVQLRAAVDTWNGNGRFDAIAADDPLRVFRTYERGYEEKRGEHRWIPGDRGYIRNPKPLVEGQEGENIIYIGGADGKGCFAEVLDGAGGFAEASRFWGHGAETKSYKDMYDMVDGWNTAPDAKAVCETMRGFLDMSEER